MPEHEEQPRAGTIADLGRRMDRIEGRHETLESEVRALTATVSRLEQNQVHSLELNKLRFDALDTGIRANGNQLTEFIRRVEGLISGEVQTEQTRQGREMVEDYQRWRRDVDGDRARLSRLGRLAIIALGGNALAIAAAVYAAIK